jgi:vanillate O-demethylase ferredoxin subunit
LWDKRTTVARAGNARAAGRALPPPFQASAHIDVDVNTEMTRQYWLCKRPGDSRRCLIGVPDDPASRGLLRG